MNELIDRLREAAQPDRPVPADLAPYLEKVRLHAYEVTDRDVDELKAAGFTEDQIFEHGLGRHRRGPRPTRRGTGDPAVRLDCVDAVQVERPRRSSEAPSATRST
jgi:hypothetical protein